MVHASVVSQQLRRINAGSMFWCRAEVRELPKILFEGEQLQHLVTGRYEGGFALLVATDYRVLLIDKKPFYLTLEDVRYDMISDVQYSRRLLDATIRLGTVHKTISFTGYNHTKLRDFTCYLQEQVTMYRTGQGVIPQTPEVVSVVPHDTVQNILADQPQPTLNPYKMPVMIRRRVSRFY